MLELHGQDCIKREEFCDCKTHHQLA